MANKHRLSPHVVPERYHLTVKPDLANFTFDGSEIISLTITKATKQLVLHAVDIDVKSATWMVGKTKLASKKITYQPKDETVTIEFPKAISKKGKLDLEFTGILAEQLRGFYRSKYTHKKKDFHMATTQFEATDARRAFPSFDEPAMKAIFEVSIIIPKHLKAISNTRESKIAAHAPGYKIVHFEPTPKMSTYLLAYIIGEFEHVQAKTKRGTLIRVHTTPGKKAQTQFSLQVAKRSLEFLENYFNIPFPLPVLDLIAIPDFSAGAMENWGAITFRETALLVDEKHTPFINKQRVAEVIAHEMVHQWFGNLVTMEWWTHLWLNESFACYMAYLVVDDLFPEWNFWTRFVLSEQSFALRADSIKTTHPIEVEVRHPNEIDEIFDDISYSKGASVLRMLSFYLGPDVFRDGLRLYLKKHSYKNTASLHLWEAFEKVSKKPITKLVQNWVSKPGYPLITVSVSGDSLSVEQERFSLSKTTDVTVWQVPIQEQVSEGEVGVVNLLTKKSQSFKISDTHEFIKLNPQEQSLYIVQYDMGSLAKLLLAMKEHKLEPIDRLSIIRNALLLVQSGKLSTDVYLEIINQVAQTEDSYIVWSEISHGLGDIEALVYGTKSESLFNAWKQRVFRGVLDRIGFVPKGKETMTTALLRGLVFVQAGDSGDKKVAATSKQLLAKHLKGNRVNPDLRLGMYSTSVKFGQQAVVNQLLAKYEQVELADERVHILVSLFKNNQSAILQKVLSFVFSGKVRTQDIPIGLMRGLSNPETKTQTWKSVKDNIALIEQHFGGTKLMGRIFEGCTIFNSKEELQDFITFTKAHSGGSRQSIVQTIEQIELNIAWKTRDLKLIEQYFRSL